ncbi:MAG: T9SS type A sorting domain-containing protein [Chitinophagales bacterium]|nr:T9SS type A sorting domain-containing protein [Chitinophagales bacterium]
MRKIFTNKFILCFVFCLTSSIFVKAQKEANTWYFSTSRGIDFNSGNAVLLTTSGMSEYEGCSSISDPTTGSILMYTDGMSVWGKNHLVMPNGSGLQSTYAAGQQGLIVPVPGNSNQYYIFTSGEYYNGGTDGYRYNIIDMTLNGGIGDVTATKNILLYAPASEKQCAIKNPAGNYWVATHHYSGNTFKIYELSGAGLSAPIISSIGTPFSGVNPDGCMKFSPDGKRIALTLGGSNLAEVFDFDINTGIVSNPITLGPIASPIPYVYGISFSPNSKLLYVTEENDKNLYQFNLDAGTPVDINNSKTAVGATASYAVQTCQLAPDGKMYVARNGGAYVAVVNFPDSIGVACNFVDNGISMAGGASSYGLPNFPEDVFNSEISLLPQSNFSADQFICQKFCVDYFDASLNAPTSWMWTFEGGSPSTSTTQNPIGICYNTPGAYDVTLVTTNAYGSDTLLMNNFMTVNATPPFPTISQTGYTLTSSIASTYQWQQNSIDIPGATNQTYTVLQTGFYTVIISDENGCVSSSTLYVLITGIENIFNDSEISVYPNPSNGIFTIDFGDANIKDEVLVDVINALGQKVFNSVKTFSSSKKEIQLPNITDGVYFLQIKNNSFNNSILLFQQKILIIN